MTALIEADALGQFRTGAASGVATRKLARPDAATAGCIGTGKQARTQLLAMARVCGLKSIRVYGRDAERRRNFAAKIAEETKVETVPVERAEDAARGCDIVITATSAREPVLKGEWLAEGTHVNLIGSNFHTKSEADVEVFRRAVEIAVISGP